MDYLIIYACTDRIILHAFRKSTLCVLIMRISTKLSNN